MRPGGRRGVFRGPWVLTKPPGASPSLAQQLGSPAGGAREARGWPGLLSRGESLGSRKWSGVLCESRRRPAWARRCGGRGTFTRMLLFNPRPVLGPFCGH